MFINIAFAIEMCQGRLVGILMTIGDVNDIFPYFILN